MKETLQNTINSLERICIATELEDEYSRILKCVERTSDEFSADFYRLVEGFLSGQQSLFNDLGTAPRDPQKLKQYLALGAIGKNATIQTLRGKLMAFKREFKKLVRVYEEAV